MSEPNQHIAADHAAAESPFSDTQLAFLRAEDYAAGKAVVILMLGIFSIGVLLYAAVAYAVWSRIGFLG